MKKIGFITSAVLLSGMGVAAYIMFNKDTTKKANKFINDMLDEADNMIKNKSN